MKFPLNYLQKTLLVSGVILTMPAFASDWDRPETTVTTRIYMGCDLSAFKANGHKGCSPVEEYTWTSGGSYLTGFRDIHGFFINDSTSRIDVEEWQNLKTIVTSQGESLGTNIQSIENLEGKISTLTQQQSQQETSLNSVQNTVTVLEGKVEQNTQDIMSNKMAIQQNKELIVKGINIATDNGTSNYQLGDTIQLRGGMNIQTQQHNGSIAISLVDNPQFNGEVNAKGGLVAHHYFATAKNTVVDFGGNRVQSVGDAVYDSDAVNLGQLKRFGTHMNNEVKSLHKQLRQARKTAHAGTASALAVASMPQAWDPDQTGMSLGTAVYRGETGYALGLSRMSSSGRWIVKGALTADSRGGMGASIGTFFSFD